MEQSWESLFSEIARLDGHSDWYIRECLTYAQNLQSNNVPVIFDTNHFLRFFPKLTEARLNSFKMNLHCYKEYFIRKKSGGVRHISAPYADLKFVQRWIYENILSRKLDDISSCVHGFMPKETDNVRNILSNAKIHSGTKWLINIDLSNFFDTIKYDSVWGYFKSLGYEDEVVTLLSKICTYKHQLPQGAPTSPILSNLIARPMDDDLVSLANKYNCNYSRYADDITFSGISIRLQPTIREIYEIIYKHHFYPNKKKTKISYPGDRQMVTGLTVSNGIHVPKKYRKDVWKELYCCKKFGVENQKEFRHPAQGMYKYWLLGRIMYVRSIEPDCGNKMLEEFNKLNWTI